MEVRTRAGDVILRIPLTTTLAMVVVRYAIALAKGVVDWDGGGWLRRGGVAWMRLYGLLAAEVALLLVSANQKPSAVR